MRIVIDFQGAQNESRFRGIGRYSMALARAMARNAGAHDLWIVLNARFPDSIAEIVTAFDGLLPPDRIRVFEVPAPLNQIDVANRWRVRAAELVREQFFAALRPDIVHITSWFEGPLDDTVMSIDRLGLGIPHAVTLYDLIPLLRPDSYLPEVRVRNWYFRKTEALRRADLLLAISKSSANEAREGLLVPDEHIAVIGAGVDEYFSPPGINPERDAAIRHRYGLTGPFILYTGAADPRKNLNGLLRAMAQLPGDVREKYLLACVGKMFPHQQQDLKRLIASLGLAPDRILLLGYVPDADLVPLYAMCELFVFPSLHEGFGLPAAEAMACGAPVVGSNTTSVPAVIGRPDAMFDPTSPSDMARCMMQVLGSQDFQMELRAHGIRQAAMFSWRDVARRTIESFEALHERQNRRTAVATSLTPTSRPRLAVVAPLSSQRGKYPLLWPVLSELSSSFEITWVREQTFFGKIRSPIDVPIRNSRWFLNHGGGFDFVLYVLRDDPSSGFALRLLETWPGIVLLRDEQVPKLIGAASRCATSRAETAVYDSHGLSALIAAHRSAPGGGPSLACSEALFRLSDGVLVHDQAQIDIARRHYGSDAAARMRVVPMPAANGRSAAEIAASWRVAIMELSGADQKLERGTLDSISAIELPHTREDLAQVASALAANTPRFGLPQILVDVSTIAETDARTGIQRVVRSILSELLLLAPEGWRIEPVRAKGDGYVYARDFAARAFNLPQQLLPPDAPVETRRGDIFLGLDLIAHLLPPKRRWFEAQQLRGVSVNFIVYDLLPLRRPELFPSDVPPMFRKWSAIVAEMADGVICISRSVADEFSAWVAELSFPRRRPLRIGWFHLGADLEASLPTTGLPPDVESILASLKARPTFLSVGTLEPRKRHAQTLDAFDLLWAQGVDAGLVIVGQQGWRTAELAARISNHPEFGRRLFWLRGISDEMLTQVYGASTALLTATEGEGFGLPLIEAARHRVPILARDLAVFREVAGDHAAYFSGEDPQSLTTAIQEWLALRAADRHPKPDDIKYQTWRKSAQQLVDVVLRGAERATPDIESKTYKRSALDLHADIVQDGLNRFIACD